MLYIVLERLQLLNIRMLACESASCCRLNLFLVLGLSEPCYQQVSGGDSSPQGWWDCRWSAVFSSRHKLKYRKSCFNLRNNFLILQVVKDLNSLMKEEVESVNISRNIWKLTGCAPEQPAVIDPVLNRELRLEDLQKSLPTSEILWK